MIEAGKEEILLIPNYTHLLQPNDQLINKLLRKREFL